MVRQREPKCKKIYIVFDSQVALKIQSKIVLFCYQTLKDLGKDNSVKLYLVLSHSSLAKNAKTNELAKEETATSKVAAYVICGITLAQAKTRTRDWTS